ncbi:MAG: hypothetical protein P1U46_00635 [Patescibacteria group bacterium]|nr:hypothetical protein [Patescibacteria group bacterium]
MAIIVLFLVLFITVLFRKYFYFSICKNNKIVKKEKKIQSTKKESIEDEPEIYINKEIK